MELNKKLSLWKEDDVRTITLIVTEDCQLRCKYCYICGKNSFKKMPLEIAKQSIDAILNDRKNYRESSVIWDFIGGEPFMEIELIDKIADYILHRTAELNHPWKDSFRFSFSTNGLLYDSPQVQAFIDKYAPNISIGFSVDGTKEKHDQQRVFASGEGSYDAVVKNVPLWLSQFKSGTKATLSHDDLTMVKDSILNLWNLGIQEVAMNCIFEDVWQEGDDIIFENQLKELADIIIDKKLYQTNKCTLFDRTIGFEMDPITDNNNWCGAGRMTAIDTEGNFHPCVRFAQYSLEHKKEITTGSCKTGLDTNRIRPFIALNRTVQSRQECIDCAVASGCAWCQGYNYDAADSATIYQRAVHHCRMHKARVRANNYLWNKLDKLVPPQEDDLRLTRLRARKGLQSLIVVLNSAAPTFCYYNANSASEQKTFSMKGKNKITAEELTQIADFALVNNLTLNLIVDKEGLPENFRFILRWNTYIVIAPYEALNAAPRSAADSDSQNSPFDVITFDFESDEWNPGLKIPSVVLKIESRNLAKIPEWLHAHSLDFNRLSLIIKDMDSIKDRQMEGYQSVLDEIKLWLPEREEIQPLELSFLTDRLILKQPHDCAAGVKHFTIAPDGKVYLCPGFYYQSQSAALCSLAEFIEGKRDFPNKQLFRREYAPICKDCDAFHCKRCLWINQNTTGEINTPSEQQCVCTHRERNAARDLIEPLFLSEDVSIPAIDYLDPFQKLVEKQQGKNGADKEC